MVHYKVLYLILLYDFLCLVQKKSIKKEDIIEDHNYMLEINKTTHIWKEMNKYREFLPNELYIYYIGKKDRYILTIKVTNICPYLVIVI